MICASMIRECLLRRRDLEDPFGHASNQASLPWMLLRCVSGLGSHAGVLAAQLPIDDLHIDFNERLWAVTQRIFMNDAWHDTPSRTHTHTNRDVRVLMGSLLQVQPGHRLPLPALRHRPARCRRQGQPQG